MVKITRVKDIQKALEGVDPNARVFLYEYDRFEPTDIAAVKVVTMKCHPGDRDYLMTEALKEDGVAVLFSDYDYDDSDWEYDDEEDY
jgi:hypothetical protein